MPIAAVATAERPTAVATSTAATLLHFAFYIAKLSGSWASCLHVLCIFTLIEIVAGNWKKLLLLQLHVAAVAVAAVASVAAAVLCAAIKSVAGGKGAVLRPFFCLSCCCGYFIVATTATSLVCPGFGHSSNLIYPVSWFSWRPYKCPTSPCPAMVAFSRFSRGCPRVFSLNPNTQC